MDKLNTRRTGRRRCITTLFCMLFAANSWCQGSKYELSVSDAVRLAVKHSEDIKISRESTDKMKNKYKEVRSIAFPQVNGSMGWQRNIEASELRPKQNYEASAGATLTQVVWGFGKVALAIDLAREAFKLQQISESAAENEVSFVAERMYYTILFAEGALLSAENSYSNARKNEKALKKRFLGGRASRTDNVKMAADIAVRKPQVLAARNRLELLITDFKTLTGLEDEADIEFTDELRDEFPEYEYGRLRSKMLQDEPTLKTLRQSVEFNDTLMRLKKRDYFPTLNAFAAYDYSGDSPDKFPKDDMYSSAVAGLNLTMPIWDSGARLGSYRQARNDYEIALLELDKTRKSLEAQLKSAVFEYDTLKEVYKADKNALALAKKSYEIILESFSSGSASLIQLNDAERTLTSAEIEVLNALYSINVLLARIKKLTGGDIN